MENKTTSTITHVNEFRLSWTFYWNFCRFNKMLSCQDLLMHYIKGPRKEQILNGKPLGKRDNIIKSQNNLGPCHSSCGWSQTAHRKGPGSRPGQSMWGLWWRMWHWNRFSPRPSVSPVSIIASLLHIHKFISAGWTGNGSVTAAVPCRLSPPLRNSNMIHINIFKWYGDRNNGPNGMSL